MATYQKLADVGAIWNVEYSRPDTFYGLEIPEFLPNSGRSQVIFMDIVFQANMHDRFAIPMPDAVATSLGKSSITFDEYLKALRTGGFDVDDLLKKSNAAEESFSASIVNRRTKAEAFFELIKTQWIVDDEDVKKHIDGDSIYDLLELVLTHTDTTRARMKAVKRHHENRSMKADVFVWLDANMVNFKSMDSAAETIAKTVAPIAFRTARDWTGEWKKLRSASTP